MLYCKIIGLVFTLDSVFGFLEKCGLHSPDASQAVDAAADDDRPFGDLRKLVLETFVKQMYVRKTKVTTEASNEVSVQLEWGQRAELELSKRDVLAAVAQLMGRTAVSFQKQQSDLQAADELAEQQRLGAESGSGMNASQRSQQRRSQRH